MVDLIARIEFVREMRARRLSLQSEVDQLESDLMSRYSALYQELGQANIDLKVAEEKLRAATLEAYQETGNKKPAPGVGVRITKCVEYDPKFALTWAKNQGIAIKLDASAFEKAVLAFSEDDRKNLGLDEICKVWEKPQATIAKEL